MGGHEAAAPRMVVDGAHDLALGRTCVYDYLVSSALLEDVQHLGKHLHCSADRDGHHDHIAPADAVLKRDHLVHQADVKGGGCIHRIILDTDDGVCKRPPLEVQGHRTADEAQTDHTDCHRILSLAFSILAKALSSSSGLAHKEMRM